MWPFGERKPKKVHSEEQLGRLAKNDNYALIRAFKIAVCFISIMVVVILAFGFLWQYTFDQQLHAAVNDRILQNISGIIFFIISLFGIKVVRGVERS